MVTAPANQAACAQRVFSPGNGINLRAPKFCGLEMVLIIDRLRLAREFFFIMKFLLIYFLFFVARDTSVRIETIGALMPLPW